MGAHRGRGRAGRPLAGRLVTTAAAGAVLAVITGFLLTGVGVADEGSGLASARPVASAAAPVAEPIADKSTRDETTQRVPAKAPVAPAEAPAGGGPGAPVSGTPCTASARACVDLTEQTAWLIENGEIKRGPVGIMIGSEEEPTPDGKFTVEWKARDYTSRELLAEMPYAVFFAPGGIAFHEGRQDTYSAGCVKLTNADAVAWFDFLQVGDEVQVVRTVS